MKLSTLYSSFQPKFNHFVITLGIVLNGVWILSLSPKVVALEWKGGSFPVENFQGYKTPFGYYKLPNGSYDKKRFHQGLDFVAPEGSFVRNWWAGKVIKVAVDLECGTSITVQSGDWQHTYCNLKGTIKSNGKVKYLNDLNGGIQILEGQTVETGTRIGRITKGERLSSSHLHWILKYRRQLVDPALVLQAMYSEQHKKQQNAKITVNYNSPIKPMYKIYEEAFKNSRLLENDTDVLSKKLALSSDITVTLKECGQPTAFYKVNRDEVVICYEMLDLYTTSTITVSKADYASAIQLTANMIIFTLHHELAHALIDQLELSLVKPEEDAADELASILIFLSNPQKFAQLIVDSASLQFLIFSTNSLSHAPIKNEHSPDKQRAYDLGCLAYGASPNTASPSLRKYVNESNEQRCVTNYNQAKTYWTNILEPYLSKN